jgi:hypothetical protein
MATPPSARQEALTSTDEGNGAPQNRLRTGSSRRKHINLPPISESLPPAPEVDDRDRANPVHPSPPHHERSKRHIAQAFYYYLHFTFPYLYLNRVDRVLDIAKLSKKDVNLLMELTGSRRALGLVGMATTAISSPQILDAALHYSPREMRLPLLDYTVLSPHLGPLERNMSTGTPTGLTKELDTFHKEWKSFVTAAIQEWTNLNIVSALLLT